MYYLGVDGGGTKTAFCLTDDTGKIVKLMETGTCHIDQVGQDGIRKVFSQFLSELEEMGIEKKSISGCFLGIPGYSEVEHWDKQIHQVASEFFTSYHCGNDAVAGWAGSLKCESGINLVAGTGAIAFGMNNDKETSRSSGWGQFCGDEGSAFWIGKKGIEAFTKQADYRHDRGPLYDVFKQDLKLDKDFDLIDLIHNQWDFSRTKVATISMLVSKAADLGDRDAIEILQRAAYEISLMVRGVVRQINFDGKIKISYSGGVFKAGDHVLKPLKAYLEDMKLDYELNQPELAPVLGSALYAYILTGKTADEKFISNLKESYNEFIL